MTAEPKSRADKRFMGAAIRFARRHQGLTGTNPSVSCILMDEAVSPPRIIGAGVTALGGRPHAEPLAIEHALADPRGAVAYVTLEPCAHHGRTPPCAQALIDAGINRVFTSIVDPDGRVSGKGHAMLREAGIEVSERIAADYAHPGLAAYLNQKTTNRAQVTLKLAVSGDGYLGLEGAGQIAITDQVARSQSHLLRANHHAIMVGAGTICEDDPSLNCRLPGLEGRSPVRVILDANGRSPLDATVFKTADKIRTIMVAPHDLEASRRNALAQLGCEFLACEMGKGLIALPELLEDLGAMGLVSILVEGGAALARSFLEEDLVDELVLFEGGMKIASSGKKAVASPVSPGNVPSGFEADYHLELCGDRMTRYRRIRNS